MAQIIINLVWSLLRIQEHLSNLYLLLLYWWVGIVRLQDFVVGWLLLVSLRHDLLVILFCIFILLCILFVFYVVFDGLSDDL